MEKITFDINKLNKADRKIYEAMTESERRSFEATWVLLEEQKARLVQKKNASKERAAREKKALATKERRERTHRLIERGAILEANIQDPLELTNEEVKEIVEVAFHSDFMTKYIEDLKKRKVNTNDVFV